MNRAAATKNMVSYEHRGSFTMPKMKCSIYFRDGEMESKRIEKERVRRVSWERECEQRHRSHTPEHYNLS